MGVDVTRHRMTAFVTSGILHSNAAAAGRRSGHSSTGLGRPISHESRQRSDVRYSRSASKCAVRISAVLSSEGPTALMVSCTERRFVARSRKCAASFVKVTISASVPAGSFDHWAASTRPSAFSTSSPVETGESPAASSSSRA